jgi:hypothetical protein
MPDEIEYPENLEGERQRMLRAFAIAYELSR